MNSSIGLEQGYGGHDGINVEWKWMGKSEVNINKLAKIAKIQLKIQERIQVHLIFTQNIKGFIDGIKLFLEEA